jgi:hypothetical protein
MRTTGWVLGVGASLVLGPIVYVLARLFEETVAQPHWVPVRVPVRAVTSSGFRRA